MDPEFDATMEPYNEGNDVGEGSGVEAGGVDAGGVEAGALDAWEQQEEDKWESIEGELAALDPSASPAIFKYLTKELENRKTVKANPEYIRSYGGKVTLVQKIFVNVDEAPEDNWVGKILGFKGKHFREIAGVANVKLAIQGRGSSKTDDIEEEEKLIDGKTQNEHLKEPLHVRVESCSFPSRAWRNMQYAIDMLVPHMTTQPSAEAVANAAAAVATAAMNKQNRAESRPSLGPKAPRYEEYDYYGEYDDYYAGYAAPPPRARPRPYDPYVMMPGKVHDPSRGRGQGRGRAGGRPRPY